MAGAPQGALVNRRYLHKKKLGSTEWIFRGGLFGYFRRKKSNFDEFCGILEKRKHLFYRQAVWAARDLPRLRKKLSELDEERDTLYAADPSRERLTRNGSVSDMTGKKAAELAQLSQRVRAMEAAFEITPDKFRRGLSGNLSPQYLEALAEGRYLSIGGKFENFIKKFKNVLEFYFLYDIMIL